MINKEEISINNELFAIDLKKYIKSMRETTSPPLSRRKIAEKMGYSESTLRKWESGVVKITKDNFYTVCDFCNFDSSKYILLGEIDASQTHSVEIINARTVYIAFAVFSSLVILYYNSFLSFLYSLVGIVIIFRFYFFVNIKTFFGGMYGRIRKNR